MNEHYTTMNYSIPPMGHSNDSVSMSDINSLLRGKNYGVSNIDQKPFEMNPSIPEYNEDDLKELQEYCAKRGIIGVNFGGRNPKAVLQMLKARMGERSEPVSKKGMLYG
jgi:hypothetical protein